MDNREKILAVQHMQDYIENNLQKAITLGDLAKAAGYSPGHSVKIFKELIGYTPFEYIRALRLSQAALQLQKGQKRVIDVALDFVFDSHEGFSRAFTQQFGLPPKRYSQNPPPIPLFIPFPIQHQYLEVLKGEKTMEQKNTTTVFVQVIERPARKLLFKPGKKAQDYFSYCEEVSCDVWGILCSVKEALYEPVGLWLPPNLKKEGISTYVQGVEVPLDYQGQIPQDFEILELPACSMMIFQGPPFADEDFMEAISDLWAVMKTYDPTLYGYTWDDQIAPRFQMEPQGYRGYIEGRPVRPVNK